MRWSLANRSEVVGGRHNSTPEMMLPESIDHDASDQWAGSGVKIGQPLGERRATITGCRVAILRRGDLQVGLGGRSPLEHPRVTGRDDFNFLGDVAATQQVRFRIKVRKAAIIGVVREMRQPFGSDQDTSHFRAGTFSLDFADSRGKLLIPSCLRAIPGEHHGPIGVWSELG